MGRHVGSDGNPQTYEMTEFEDVAELPADALAPWRKVDDKCRSEKLKHGMRLRLGGISLRNASNNAGISQAAIRDGLHRYGLLEISRRVCSESIVDGHREIALETNSLQLEKLAVGDPDPKLAIVGGISTDKVANSEQWTKRGEAIGNLGDCLIDIAERIVAGGGKLDLTISGPGGEAKIEAGGNSDA